MARRAQSTGRTGRAALALAAIACVPAVVAAQPAETFSLPPGGTPTPPAAGSVDPERPSASPTPAPSPPPRIVLPPPRATPSARPTPAPSPRPTATATPARPAAATAPVTAPSPAPAAVPTAAIATPGPITTESAGPSDVEATPAPQDTAPADADDLADAKTLADLPWWLFAAAAALVLLIGLGIWRLLRKRPPALYEEAAGETPGPLPATPAPPVPAPGPALPPRAPHQPLGDTAAFELVLEPLRMTLALINATLVYRLAITNHGTAPLGPLRITCDMIAAHASLDTAQQLTPDPALAWLSHEFEAIPPGGNMVIDGELRLPREEILPIRIGSNSLFVPLARFTLQTLERGYPEQVGARVFVVGADPDRPGGPLKPFRLNEGTRSHSRISQREIAITA